MSWYTAIYELCCFVVHAATVKDILATAVEENMLSLADVRDIMTRLGFDEDMYEVSFN